MPQKWLIISDVGFSNKQFIVSNYGTFISAIQPD